MNLSTLLMTQRNKINILEYISVGDSFIEIQGDEKQVAQFNDDILNGKIKFELSKTPVKLTKKNFEKYLK